MNKKQLKEVDRQEVIRKWCANLTVYCQSALVDEMLKREVFSYEDIENLYEYKCPECGGGYHELKSLQNDNDDLFHCSNCDKTFEDEPENEPQEILEWWIVDSWLLARLKERGEPVLDNDWGEWWGRCTSGQAIFMDGVIEGIYSEYNEKEKEAK